MYCMKCNKLFPWECTCDNKEERLASLSGRVVFQLPNGKIVTPIPVQPKQKKAVNKQPEDLNVSKTTT